MRKKMFKRDKRINKRADIITIIVSYFNFKL